MVLENRTTLNHELQRKLKQIETYFKNKTVVIAFSGGVDSTVIAELANQYAKRSIAVTADSITVLPGEINFAINLAKERGWEHRVVNINELEDENFVANPTNRCYYCKVGLSESLHNIANEIEADIIVEGTNVSELTGHRPGLKALKENKIKSPFLKFKITKPEIRDIARYFALANAEKPSLACLSSRFPYGVKITPEKLQRVGLAERYIIDTYSIKILRVRDHDGMARIEVAPEERIKLLYPEVLDDLDIKLKKLGFTYVSLDARGYRTGALNEVLEIKEYKDSAVISLDID